MSAQTNQWLQLYASPWESDEEALRRLARQQGLDAAGTQALLDEHTQDQSQNLAEEAIDYSQVKPIIYGQQEPSECVADPGLGDLFGRGVDIAQAGIGRTLSGPVAGFLENTLGFEDAGDITRLYGEDITRSNLEEAAQVAPAKSREEIIQEDPTSLYRLLPEDFPTFGQMVEQAPPSFLAATGAAAAGIGAGLVTGNPLVGAGVGMLTGNALSSLQVGGEAYGRAQEEPAVRRALGISEETPFAKLDPVEQGKVNDLATKISQNSTYNRLFNAGALEMASYIPYGPFWARYLLDVGLGTASEEIDRRMYAEDVIQGLVDRGVPEQQIPELREEILARGPTQRETLLQAFAMEATFGAPFAAIEGLAGDHRVDPQKTSTKEQLALIKKIQEEDVKAQRKEFAQQDQNYLKRVREEINLARDREKYRQEVFKTEQLMLPDPLELRDQAKTAEDVSIKQDPTGKKYKKPAIIAGTEAPYRRPPKRGGTQAKTGIPEQAPSAKIKPKASVPKQKLIPQKTSPVPFGTQAETDTKLLENVTPPKTAKEAVKMMERARRGEPIATDPDAKIPINETYAAKALGFTDKDGNADVEAYRSIFPDQKPEDTVISFSKVGDESPMPQQDFNAEATAQAQQSQATSVMHAQNNPGVLSNMRFKSALNTLTRAMPGLKKKIVFFDNHEAGVNRIMNDLGLSREDAVSAVYGSEGFVTGDVNSPIYLNRENIRGADTDQAISRLVQVVFHEALGHKGLRESMGGKNSKQYKKFINGFYKANKKNIEEWVAGEGRYSNDTPFTKAEEYIAVHFAEFGAKDPTFNDKLAASFQDLFNSVGLSKKVNMEQVKVAMSNVQDQYMGTNRNIITGAGLAQAATGAETDDVSQSRISDYDRFVSFGGKPPLRQYDRPVFDAATAPKKTAQDAVDYVDNSILKAMRSKVWPEQLVKDLSNFESFPQEFQDSFRKSMKSGLRKREQELANAVLAKGREAYLQKKKGNITPSVTAPKGYEPGGAKWKELVDDVPKFARTTPEIQRATRREAQERDTISQSKLLYGKEKPSLDARVAGIERGRSRLNEVLNQDDTGGGRSFFTRGDRPDRKLALASYALPPDTQREFESLRIGTPTVFELDPTQAAPEFHKAISDAKEANPFSSAVYVYPQDEYAQMRLFLTDDNSAGFALKGDDIVSVFNTPKGKYNNVVPEFLLLAVEQGGRKLDAFDTVLPSLYSQAGFRVASRLEWDPNESPPDWNEADFARFNGGKPDVVFMAYSPRPAKVLKPAPAKYDTKDIDRKRELVDDYGVAVNRQSMAVNRSRAIESLDKETMEAMQAGFKAMTTNQDLPDLSSARKRINYIKKILGNRVSTGKKTPFRYTPDGSIEINQSALSTMSDMIDLTRYPVRVAFHGSARRALEDSRFKLKFLLTGEGHILYGWGVYFTEDIDVARWYRDKDVERKALAIRGLVGDIEYDGITDGKQTYITGGSLAAAIQNDMSQDNQFRKDQGTIKVRTPEVNEDFLVLGVADLDNQELVQELGTLISKAQQKTLGKAQRTYRKNKEKYEKSVKPTQEYRFQNNIRNVVGVRQNQLAKEILKAKTKLDKERKLFNELKEKNPDWDWSFSEANFEITAAEGAYADEVKRWAGLNWLNDNAKRFKFDADAYKEGDIDKSFLEGDMTGGIFKQPDIPNQNYMLDVDRDLFEHPVYVKTQLMESFDNGNVITDESRPRPEDYTYIDNLIYSKAARVSELLYDGMDGPGYVNDGGEMVISEGEKITGYDFYMAVADYFRTKYIKDNYPDIASDRDKVLSIERDKGGELVQQRTKANQEGKKGASLFFDSLGIPGMQFIIGTQRGRMELDDPKVKRNFVIWDQGVIGQAELSESRLIRFVRGDQSENYGFSYQKGGRWLTLDAEKPWVVGPDNEDVTGKVYAQTHINTQNASGKPLMNVSNFDLGLTLQDVNKIGKTIMPKEVQIEGDRMSGPNPIFANLYDRSRAPGKHTHDGLKKGAWAYTKTPKYINREVPQIVSLTSKDIVAWNKSKGTGKSDHIYAHEVVYNVPTALGSFPEFKNEPRGRPYTYGEIVVGEPVSEIVHARTSVKMPVYDRVYIVSPGDQPLSPEFMEELYDAMDSGAPHPTQVVNEVDAAMDMINRSALKMESDLRKEQIDRMPNTLAKAKAIHSLRRFYTLNPLPDKFEDTPYPAMLKDLPKVETSFSRLIAGKKPTKQEIDTITDLIASGKQYVSLEAVKEMMGDPKELTAIDIVLNFMRKQREKILKGKLQDRDIVKALSMTSASQGMSGTDIWSVWDRTGGAFKLPETQKWVNEGDKGKSVHYFSIYDFVNKINDEVGRPDELGGKLTEKKVQDYYNKAPLLQAYDFIYNKSSNEIEDISFLPEMIEDNGGKMKKLVANRIIGLGDAARMKAMGAKLKYGDGVPWMEGDNNVELVRNPEFDKFLKDMGLKEDGLLYTVPPEPSQKKDTTGGRGKPFMGTTRGREMVVEGVKVRDRQGGFIIAPEAIKDVGEFSAINFKDKKLQKKYEGQRLIAVPSKYVLQITNARPERTRTVNLPPQLPLWYKDPKNSKAPSKETGALWVPTEYGDDRGFVRAEDGLAWWFTTDAGQLALDYTDFVNKVGRIANEGKKTKVKPNPAITKFLIDRGVLKPSDALKGKAIGADMYETLKDQIKVIWRPGADIRIAMGDDRIADVIAGKDFESGRIPDRQLMPGQTIQEVRDPEGSKGEPGYRPGQAGSFVWLGNVYGLTNQFNLEGKNYSAYIGKKKDTPEQRDADALKRRELAGRMRGYVMTMATIAEGKEGFFKHMLGLGDVPTIDAIEYNIHIAGTPSLTWTDTPLVGIDGDDNFKDLLDPSTPDRIPEILKDGMDPLPVKTSWRQQLIKEGFGAARGNTIQVIKDQIKDRFDKIIFTTDPKTGKRVRQGGWADIDLDLIYHMGHHLMWDRAKGIKRGYQWPKSNLAPNINEIGGTELIFRPGVYQAMLKDRHLLTSGGMRNWYQMSKKDQLNILSHSRLLANGSEPGGNLGVTYNWPAGLKGNLSKSLLPNMGLPAQEIDDIFTYPHQTTMADRLRIGTYYPRDPNNKYLTGLYGPRGGIHEGRIYLMGGMGYPMIASMYNNNIAYAAEGLGPVSETMKLMHEKGAIYMDVLLMGEDVHFGNKQMWEVISGEIKHEIDNKRIKVKDLNDAIQNILDGPATFVQGGKDATGKKYAAESWGKPDSPKNFKNTFEKAKKQTGKDNWETMDWLFRQDSDQPLSSSFRFRLASMYQLGGKFSEAKQSWPGGVIPADLMNYIWENTVDQPSAMKNSITGIIKLDANATTGMKAVQAGVPIHPAYQYVVPGQVVATFTDPLPPELILMGTNPDSWINSLNQRYTDLNKLDKKGNLVQGGWPVFEPFSMGKDFKRVMDEGTQNIEQMAEGATGSVDNAFYTLPDGKWIFGANKDFMVVGRPKGRNFGKANADGFSWYRGRAYKYDRTLEIERALRAPHLDPRFHTGLAYSRLPLNQSAYALSSQRAAGTWSGKVQNWLTAAVEPLGKIPMREQYMQARRKAKGEVYKIEKAGREVYNALKNTKSPKQIYDYLTTRGANSSMIDNASERAAAVRAKIAINEIGQRLLDAGLLGQAAIDAHGDRYLPRLYLKYLLNENDQNAIAMGQKPSDLGYLKKRRNIEDGVRELILGEIKDPAFLASKGMMTAGRDLALLDWLSWISQNPDWVLPNNMARWDMLGEMRKLTDDPQLIQELQLRDTGGKRVTGYWLKNEAQRLTDQILPNLEEGSAKEKLLVRLIRKMNQKGNQVLGQEVIPQNYKKIPNTKRYGDLRGMVVRKEIYEDILGGFKAATGDESLAEQVLGDTGAMGKFNNFFKWAKVSANPPSWVRNFVSNMILMNLAGVPLYKLPSLFISGVRAIKNNDEAYKIAVDNGLVAGTFSNVELGRIEREFSDLQRRMKRDNRHPMNWVSQVQGAFNGVRDKTGDWYGGIDSLGKVMMIKWGMEKGMKPEEAVAIAEKWLFDYSLVKPSVRYLRNAAMGAPFVTFTSKVAPLLLETLLTKPWRFAPYWALAWGLTEMFKNNNDLDDEQLEGLKTALVPYLREKASAGNVVPLPWLDDNGKVQFFDLSYLFPWGMFTEIAVEIGNGQLIDALKTVGMMGGPMMSIGAALTTGIDPFTRRPIANELDTPGQQAADWMWYYYNLAMPPMMHADFGVLKRVKEAMTGELTPEGEQRFTKAQALARLGGMNVTPIDPVTSRQKSIRSMQSDILKLIRDRNRNIRERIKMKQSKEEINEARQEFNERIKERRLELREFIKKTRVPE